MTKDYLYHGTMEPVAEAIEQKGLCSGVRRRWPGMPRGIFATDDIDVAAIWGEWDTEVQRMVAGREGLALDIYRFKTSELPSRCRVEPDPANEDAVFRNFLVTGCRCIPPHLLERCRVDKWTVPSLEEQCSGQWEKLK